MSVPFNNNPFGPFGPVPGSFPEPWYDPLQIHDHLHDGLAHVGDRVITQDFVIRHQFDINGDLIGGMPEITPRFKPLP